MADAMKKDDGAGESETLPPKNEPSTLEKPSSSDEQSQSVISPGSTSNEQSTEEKKASEAVVDEQKERALRECCGETFTKITEYVNGELSASLEDYVLLEKLNQLTTTKYSDMSNMAKTLITAMEELDGKYKGLQPYLEQIDKVEESVASLEQAAYRLDAYSKKLETKFKKLERR